MKKFILLSLLFISLITPSVVNAIPSDLLIEQESDPLFNETNWVPGASVSKTVTVTNLSETETYLFGIATFDEEDPDKLATQLELQIRDQDGIILYGTLADPKTLDDLFKETEFSEIPGMGKEINLITLSPKEKQTISIKVSFPTVSGNEWQAKIAQFSFGLGWTETGIVSGESTKESRIGETLGVALSQTGQNIIVWVVGGGGLILLSRRLIKKKK